MKMSSNYFKPEKIRSLWTSYKSDALEFAAFIIQCFLICSALFLKPPKRELFSLLANKFFGFGKYITLSESHAGVFISVNQ